MAGLKKATKTAQQETQTSTTISQEESPVVTAVETENAEEQVDVETSEEQEEQVVAVATDDVPDGEPTEGENGSVTVYDEDNEPVGTLSAEEVQKVEESVTGVTVEVDSDSPMEQLFHEDAPKVEVSAEEVQSQKMPKENVKVRLRSDHSCCIAMERYDFVAGKVYTVPKNVKRILNRAGLLAPV